MDADYDKPTEDGDQPESNRLKELDAQPPVRKEAYTPTEQPLQNERGKGPLGISGADAVNSPVSEHQPQIGAEHHPPMDTDHPQVEREPHTQVEAEHHPQVEAEHHPQVDVEHHPQVEREHHPQVEREHHPQVEAEHHPYVETEHHPHVETERHPPADKESHPQVSTGDQSTSSENGCSDEFLNIVPSNDYTSHGPRNDYSIGAGINSTEDESTTQVNKVACEVDDENGPPPRGKVLFAEKMLTHDDLLNLHPNNELERPKEPVSMEQLVQSHMRRAVEYMCNNCFDFTESVVASGNLAFLIDNKQIANVKVKEIVRACKRSLEDEDMSFGNSTSEELLAKIESMNEESADLSKSVVKIRQQHIKTEIVSDVEADAQTGYDEVQDSLDDEDTYNDTNDDDYVPEESVSRRVPKMKIKTRGRKAKTPKSLHAKKQNIFQCEHCNYTARFFGHFKNHYENKHHYLAQDLEDLEKKALGIAVVNKPVVKTENVREQEETIDDLKMNPTGTAKRDRKRIHKCDREGCGYSTDHIGHYRDHLNRHDGLRPFKCEQCPKDFVRQDDLKRHEERHLRKFECPICAQMFETRGKLREHAKSQHAYEGRIAMFSCSICKASFSTHEELEKHTLEKHNHMCSICGEAFSVKRDLAKHRMAQHKDEVLKCQICGKSMPTTTALRKHVARHDTEGSQFPCDVCGKTFTASSTLYHHKRGVHTTNGEKPYACKICGQGFNFHHSMKLHILRHKGLRPHKCSLCDKSYLTATHLRGHMDAVHSAKKRFVCPICDKRFPYENSLKMHMMLHTNDRPYVCHLCGRGFVSNNALKNHEGTHVEGKNFECPVCHKKYKTEQLLRAHTRRHTNDGSRFMCDLCGNTFMYRSNLDAHMAVHGEQRNYICPDCGKCFKTAATLYSHKLVHKEETPFTCNICSKGFKSKERLAQHHHRHSGLKPFVCDRCGHAFPDKGGLSKHRKTVHAVLKKFSCPVCGKTCARADNLRVHMKIHGDPGLLSLPMEKLLAAGFEESMEQRAQENLNESENNSSYDAGQASSTNHVQTSQVKASHHHARSQENKGKGQHKSSNLNNIVDNVLDMSQGQVVNLQSVAAHQNANLLSQQGGGLGPHAGSIPGTGYQLVTTSGTGEPAYIPAAAIPPAHEQSRYANMETISASAMMLMTTNYFQPLGNSQQ